MHQTYGAASAARPPEPNDSPFCPQCGSPLRLIRVEPIRGCEKHTLLCPGCGREESVMVAPPARGTT